MPETISDEAFQAVMNVKLETMTKASDKIEKVVEGLSWRMIKLEVRIYGITSVGAGAGWYFFGGG